MYIYIYIYIQGVPKENLFYVFANISANTYSRETSRLSTELAWQEVFNNMRLDFLRYLKKSRGFFHTHAKWRKYFKKKRGANI